MAGRWRWMLAVPVALAAVACSGDDSSSPTTAATGVGLTIDALADAPPDSCPLPVDDAVSAAGLELAGAASGTVETAPPDTTAPTGNTLDLPVLQRLDAVSVSCSATTTDGAFEVLLVAGRVDAAGSASLALIPALSRAGSLTADQLQPVAEGLPDVDAGALVELPGDAAVALVRTSIDGAADAALLVSSDDLDRERVEHVATELHDLLR